MNINTSPKNGFIHLYNRKEEGFGGYDVNYINAYKKRNKVKNQRKQIKFERYAA